MKKLISLLKATMSEDMDLFKVKSKNDNMFSKIVLPILLSLILMFAVRYYAEIFAQELAPRGLTYIVLTLFVMITSVLTFIEGIYKSQGILFEAKDSNLLFSLPISKSKIFFTKIFKLLSFQVFYNLLYMIPAMVVYAIHEKPDFIFYIISIIMLVLLPIIPTILGSIIGYVINGISSRFKVKKIAQVIITSIVLVCIFALSFSSQNLIIKIAENANSINDVISKIYYPAGAYIRLIQNFNITDLLILLAITIIPAIIFIYVASIFYFKINSKFTEKGVSYSKKNIKKNKYKYTPRLSALVKKELKRFFSSPVFIINAGFGIVLMVVFTISISVNFEGIAGSFMQDSELPIEGIKLIMPKIFYGFLVYMSCMTCITSSMISLEGKSFNITKSLPVPTLKILFSKLLTSNILSIPVLLICDIIFFIGFKVAVPDSIFILVASIAIPTFSALIGLIFNLKYPKMDANTDTEVVKQSMSSMLSVLTGIIVGLVLIGAMFIGNNINRAITIELIAIIIIDIILWRILEKYGVRKFNSINI